MTETNQVGDQISKSTITKTKSKSSPPFPKYKEELCKILWVNNNSFGIDFQGYGISFNTQNNQTINNKDYMKVKYIGTIGKDDFKYEVVFD